MIGPIRGTRLQAEVKLQIVRAIYAAKAAGFPIDRACRVIMLDPRRLRRWIRRAQISSVLGSTPHAKTPPGRFESPVSEQRGPRAPVSRLTAASLADAQPIARRCPHRLTEDERSEILRAADEDRFARATRGSTR